MKRKIVLFSFLILFFIFNIFSINSLAISNSDNSIETNDYVIIDDPTWFNSTFINTDNPFFEYSNATLTFQNIANTSIVNTYNIIDLDNIENHYPNLDTYYNMTQGSLSNSNNSALLDSNYTVLTSTLSNMSYPIQPDNFTLYEGISDFNGSLIEQDNNYTNFVSSNVISSNNSYVIRPIQDNDMTGWSIYGGATYGYEAIDDPIEYPSTLDDSQYIYTYSAGVDCSFYLTGISKTIESYTIYSRSTSVSNKDFIVSIDYNDGGGFQVIGNLNNPTTENWCWLYKSGISKTGIDWKIKLETETGTTVAICYVLYIELHYSENINSELNFTSTIDMSNILDKSNINLIYSYRTNISQMVNLNIWNYDTSEWYLIDNSIYLTFTENSFSLNSSFYDSNLVLLNFSGFSPSDNFELNLDLFIISSMSFLNCTIEIQLKQLPLIYSYNFTSYQFTNVSSNVQIYYYNYSTGNFSLFSETNYISLTKISYTNQSLIYDYIGNSSIVIIRIYGNNTQTFQLNIDLMNFGLCKPLELKYQETFNLLGLWRYRYQLDYGLPSNYTQEWITFTVILWTDLLLGYQVPFWIFLIIGVLFTIFCIYYSRLLTDRIKK